MPNKNNIKSNKKFQTSSGIEIHRVYPEEKHEKEEPGQFPFTRGIYNNMYRGKLWTMRQYAGFSSAEKSNERYHYLLKQGTTGLSIAFDLPTQIGYDSDHPMAEGEVGKVGVAIDSLADMEILLHGIDPEKVSVSMTINATAFILLAMYIALAKKKGADLAKIRGTIQNDILKEYAARGTYIFPPGPSMRLITDIFEYCNNNLPKWNTISISGYHIREAGANAVQELAFTLANAKAYLQAASNRGLDIDQIGQRLSFFFNAHNNLFEEIAKFRAARRMWAHIAADMGVRNSKALMLRFHTQTGGSTLTAQQAKNNIARVSLQALAAVLGGTQSLHTNGFDEAINLPSEEAAQIALRTQQIIAFESGVADTVDPLAGSYFIESLTNEMEQKAKRYIEKIDKMGGAVSAIEQGYIQNEIARSAYEYQKQIEQKQKIIVGLNAFETDEKIQNPSLKIDESVRKDQCRKIEQLKAKRNQILVAQKLETLKQAASTNENLIPLVIDCIESYATLGEIADNLRAVFGEY